MPEFAKLQMIGKTTTAEDYIKFFKALSRGLGLPAVIHERDYGQCSSSATILLLKFTEEDKDISRGQILIALMRLMIELYTDPKSIKLDFAGKILDIIEHWMSKEDKIQPIEFLLLDHVQRQVLDLICCESADSFGPSKRPQDKSVERATIDQIIIDAVASSESINLHEISKNHPEFTLDDMQNRAWYLVANNTIELDNQWLLTKGARWVDPNQPVRLAVIGYGDPEYIEANRHL